MFINRKFVTNKLNTGISILIGTVGILVMLGVINKYGNDFNKSKVSLQNVKNESLHGSSQSEFIGGDVASQINGAWDAIESGNAYIKQNEYKMAAEEFKKAYSYKYGGKALSGLKLAETYEVLQRFDEGILVLEDMLNNKYLSETGIRNANIIKSRLLAAKNASQK